MKLFFALLLLPILALAEDGKRYFAELDGTDTVVNVMVGEAADKNLDAFVAKLPGRWVETGQDGSKSINYACISCKFDSITKAFVWPKPYSSWVLKEDGYNWKAPKDPPQETRENKYDWDEQKQDWEKKISAIKKSN